MTIMTNWIGCGNKWLGQSEKAESMIVASGTKK
jgi:hypothetical protein